MKKKKKSNKKNELVVYPPIEFDLLDLLKELIKKDGKDNRS